MTPGFFQITLKVFLLRNGPTGREFLVLKDKDSQMGDLPGGRLSESEIDEPFSRAIAREMREELGHLSYRLEEKPLFYFAHRIRNGGYPALGIAFAAEYETGEVTLSEEHDWMSWENVQTYKPEPLFQEHMLSAVLQFQNGLHLAG
jgi:8-oxo-dGTP diphosphatase